MSSRLRELSSAAFSGLGLVGISETRLVAKSTSGLTPYQYWGGQLPGEFFHTSLATAYGLTQGGRNEAILLTPDSHILSAALTWAKSETHLVGMYGPAMQNQRSRVGHAATIASLLTVSGQGNTFANVYFPYGLAATDLNLLTVTGARNSFVNCHFLPTIATALDDAAFKLVSIQAAEQYFKNCYFGGDTVAWTNGTMIDLGQSGGSPARVVFENCVFVMNADNAQVTFLKTTAGLGRCTIIFKGCQFLNLGTSLTVGIDGAGLGNAMMFFDNNSFFAGCTDVVAAANEAAVWFAPANTPVNQVTGGNSVALFNGLACHPDLS